MGILGLKDPGGPTTNRECVKMPMKKKFTKKGIIDYIIHVYYVIHKQIICEKHGVIYEKRVTYRFYYNI